MPIGYTGSKQSVNLGICTWLNTNRISYMVKGDGKISIEDGKITIFIENKKMPGLSGLMLSTEIGRIKVLSNIPTTYRKAGERYYKLFRVWPDGSCAGGTITNYIKAQLQFINSLPQPERAPTMEEIKALEAKQEEKMKRLAADREKRQEVFQQLINSIGNIGTVESMLEDEFINVTLPNNIKIRLDAMTDGIIIREVEIPQTLNLNNLQAAINKLKGL